MADKSASIKMENDETGVSDDSQKNTGCRNDKEMVEIKSEIKSELDGGGLDSNFLKERLSPREEYLVMKKPFSQELPLGIDSLLDQSKDVLNLPSSNLLNIKTEPMDHSHVHSLANASTTSESSRIADCINRLDGEQIKSELESPYDPYGDEIDHILLRDRVKLLTSAIHPLKIRRPRKKIATDSIETALAHDAPGLAQLLLEKGIDMSEIKLYGSSESDEVIDDDDGGEYSEEENFSELESVISKLFSQKPSLLKLPTLRSSGKSEKKIYCVSCLVALVEQSRFLVRRKWPVEWGWCRDLNAFIFVFRRQRRIVLERPEYGYATYAFRLSKSLPIKWQIKRLVITMKLTNCCRTTIIENRPLKVGHDLSEGEAKVLREYGWTPNTGLGTMLEYHDRFVHTVNKDENISYWKERIVKLLNEGLSIGYSPEDDIPKKAAEYCEAFGCDEKDEEW